MSNKNTEKYDKSLPQKIPLIIDCGTERIKAGIGAKQFPQFIQWNCIGLTKDDGSGKPRVKGSFDDKAFFNDVAENTLW